MYSRSGDVEIFGSQFVGNEAKEGGGGFVSHLGRLALESVLVEENTAGREGGGLSLFAPFGDIEEAPYVITNSAFQDNEALRGGGISASGWVEIANSAFIGNRADEDGGGIALASLDPSVLAIDGCEIAENFAVGMGGGVSVGGGPHQLTITGGRLAENEANDSGGGLSTHAESRLESVIITSNQAVQGGGIMATGSLEIEGSAVVGNTATSDGGGLQVIGVKLLNSLVAGNTAGARGAGLLAPSEASFVQLRFVTIAANVSESGSGGVESEGLGRILGSIVYGNASVGADELEVVAENFLSEGHNLFDAPGPIVPKETDIVGEDPLLGELGGVAMPTMEIDASSPAVDAVPPDVCTDFEGDPLERDQRGASRPAGENCDIGAFERQ